MATYVLIKRYPTKTKNIDVIYTRTTDVFISLEDRVNLANNRKADYFVSIHCNFLPKSNVSQK